MPSGDVNKVIEFVEQMTIRPDVKQVLLNRLAVPFTRDEIDRARYQLHRDV